MPPTLALNSHYRVPQQAQYLRSIEQCTPITLAITSQEKPL